MMLVSKVLAGVNEQRNNGSYVMRGCVVCSLHTVLSYEVEILGFK
jgi:hypothetical protein